MIEVVNGSSITSKAPRRTGTPLRSVAARGTRVRLEDGQWYEDWQGGLYGPCFGYAPDWWIKALKEAIWSGPASSIPAKGEVEVANLLSLLYPDIQAVRFMLNGSDPNAAAIKLARALTGRNKILKQGYHGFASYFSDDDGDNRGHLQAEVDSSPNLNFGDFEALLALKDCAAVIIELPAIMGNSYDDTLARAFLHACADEAHRHGALFILDEVVTGFRLAGGGAAEVYDLFGKVDLYCFGKALGNGYPISCLAGKAEVMKPLAGGGVHFSATFFGEPLGMAAAEATLHHLIVDKPWPYLYEMGDYLALTWNSIGLPWKIAGYPVRPHLVGPEEGLNEFRLAMFREGHILFRYPWFISTAHTAEIIDRLVEDAVEVWQMRGW